MCQNLKKVNKQFDLWQQCLFLSPWYNPIRLVDWTEHIKCLSMCVMATPPKKDPPSPPPPPPPPPTPPKKSKLLLWFFAVTFILVGGGGRVDGRKRKLDRFCYTAQPFTEVISGRGGKTHGYNPKTKQRKLNSLSSGGIEKQREGFEWSLWNNNKYTQSHS